MFELLGILNPLNIVLNVQLLVPDQSPLSIHCTAKHKSSSPRRSLPFFGLGFSRSFTTQMLLEALKNYSSVDCRLILVVREGVMFSCDFLHPKWEWKLT